MTSAVTYSGEKYSDAIKVLPYYIRRQMNAKALMVAIDLFRYKDHPDPKVKQNYTSLLRTLKLVAARDIGVGNYPLAVAVIDYLNRKLDS